MRPFDLSRVTTDHDPTSPPELGGIRKDVQDCPLIDADEEERVKDNPLTNAGEGEQ